MCPDPALRAAGRLLLAGALTGGCALVWQTPLLELAIHLFRIWLDVIDGTFRTVHLSSELVNGERLIFRLATPAVTHVVGLRVVMPNPGTLMSSSVSAGLVLQPLVLGAALVLAWPWQRWLELVLRAVLAMPLLVAVVLLDVPMMLYGSLWYDEVKAFDSDHFSLLVVWPDFMNAGGRFALTVVAVAGAVSAARRLLPRVSEDSARVRGSPVSGISPPAPTPPVPPATALPDDPPSPPPNPAA